MNPRKNLILTAALAICSSVFEQTTGENDACKNWI